MSGYPLAWRIPPLPEFMTSWLSCIKAPNRDRHLCHGYWLDGSGQTNLTHSAGDDFDSDWSPDRRRIAFYSERDGNREIHGMNADGTSQTNLANNPADDFHPDWSPDGRHIAFSSERDGDREIYVMNADGTGLTNLTNNPADDFSPVWYPFIQ